LCIITIVRHHNILIFQINFSCKITKRKNPPTSGATIRMFTKESKQIITKAQKIDQQNLNLL